MDMAFVWDEAREVPRAEVTGKDDQSVEHTCPRDEEYFEQRSRSPKSRRYMFGKADPGPTAAL